MRPLNSLKRFKTETDLLILSTTFLKEILFYKEKWNNNMQLKHKTPKVWKSTSWAICVFFGIVNFAGNLNPYVPHLLTVNKHKMYQLSRKGEKSKALKYGVFLGLSGSRYWHNWSLNLNWEAHLVTSFNLWLHFTWVDSRSIVFMVTMAEGHILAPSFYKTHWEGSVCGISLLTSDFWKRDMLWLHLRAYPVGHKPRRTTFLPTSSLRGMQLISRQPDWECCCWSPCTDRISKSELRNHSNLHTASVVPHFPSDLFNSNMVFAMPPCLQTPTSTNTAAGRIQ